MTPTEAFEAWWNVYGTQPQPNEDEMSDTEPTFSPEHEEQTWRVDLPGGEYAIYLTRYGTGLISVKPFGYDEQFLFKNSKPNTVLAIGRLLVAAARKAGATDA